MECQYHRFPKKLDDHKIKSEAMPRCVVWFIKTGAFDIVIRIFQHGCRSYAILKPSMSSNEPFGDITLGFDCPE